MGASNSRSQTGLSMTDEWAQGWLCVVDGSSQERRKDEMRDGWFRDKDKMGHLEEQFMCRQNGGVRT